MPSEKEQPKKSKLTRKVAKRASSKPSLKKKDSAEEVPESAPVVATPQPVPPVPMVLIKNLMAQVLDVTVVDDDGGHGQLRVAPRGVSVPVPKHRITAQTRRLVETGRARLLDV